MPWSTLQNWSGRFRVKIRRQQASASAGWPALRAERGLAEMQLGVVWVHPQALGTSVQSLREVSEHLVAAGDQGEELPHDGIGGGRPGQAALKVPERCGPVLSFDGDRAQVEERL